MFLGDSDEEEGNEPGTSSQNAQELAQTIALEAKWLSKMVQEMGGIQYHLVDEDIGDVDLDTAIEIPEKREPDPPKVEKELTPEELELQKLYESGMAILNKTRSDKAQAYQLLNKASVRGHKEAQAAIAWGLMFGNVLEQDIEHAKGMFHVLADAGHPSGHMVCLVSRL